MLEPLKLKIGNEYNLNNVKEIKISDEFLSLDKAIIKCQNKESLQDCQTREYIDAAIEKCYCIPFAIVDSLKNKVFSRKMTLGLVLSVCPSMMLFQIQVSLSVIKRHYVSLSVIKHH